MARVRNLAIGVLMLFACLAFVEIRAPLRMHMRRLKSEGPRTLATTEGDTPPCGLTEDEMDYSGSDFDAKYDVETAADCQDLCGLEPACKSFTFETARLACYFKNSTRPTRVKSKCCVSGLPACSSPSTSCGLTEENMDYQGSDFAAQYEVATAAACQELCGIEPECKSYTYVTASLDCYLKNSTQPSPVTSTCCISGLPACPGTANPPVDVHDHIAEPEPCGLTEEGMDYQGHDLDAKFSVPSATACQGLCGAEPACKSFSYVTASRACYLKKSSNPDRVRSNCCVSGLPVCPPGVAPATPPPPPPVYNYTTSKIMRGVAYGPLPCKEGCQVSEDMLQEGYQQLWGAQGRDDLAVIKDLGGNTVRLYHSIGLDGHGNHGIFLDHAEKVGLDVMPGYHTYNAIYGGCPDFDCYETWKRYTLSAFDQGFRRDNAWHPAVSVLLLFNELDFFRGYSPIAHVRSAVSALDGVLAAEREASVEPGRVRLSIAWSCSPGTSQDGTVSGLATWAFQDVAWGIANPEMISYTPRTSQSLMMQAYQTRWAHSINVQTPGILEYMADHYQRFEPIPWFIGEYGANGLSKEAIESELRRMDSSATDEHNPFMGMSFFQFQAAYFKGGSEMNFGLFRLGDKQIAETGDICDKGNYCRKWPVYCLTTSRGSLPEFVEWRADAVASAWGGMISRDRMC